MDLHKKKTTLNLLFPFANMGPVVLEEVLSENMVFSTFIWLRRGAYMPLNMFFIKKNCIFDHSSQLAFLPKSIACKSGLL